MKPPKWSLFLLTCLPQAISAAFLSLPEEPAMQPTATKSYDAATLAKDFPPVLKDPNLRLVYDIATPAKATGTLTYSRWPALSLPAKLPAAKPAEESRPDFFTYAPPADKNAIEWHLNFANIDLFAYYGSGLFAQDEMQVAEHPTLASLRRALLHDKLSTLTVEAGKPTPILIRGIQRRAKIATGPNTAEGRPNGLYGNNFAHASTDAVRRATIPIDPPTITNLIAIEAPAYGNGDYTPEQIRFILTTAYTGFRAAKLAWDADTTKGGDHPKVVIHTGFWGCGAYGGNRTLMTALQLLAARLAEVDQIIYHTGDKQSQAQFTHAQDLLAKLITKTTNTDAFIDQLTAQKFEWGTSDGN